jgi:Trk K+ transport system NAD-binding subunit
MWVIIGLGRFGMSLALKLETLGHTVMAIDEDPILVQSVADSATQGEPTAGDGYDVYRLCALTIVSSNVARLNSWGSIQRQRC